MSHFFPKPDSRLVFSTILPAFKFRGPFNSKCTKFKSGLAYSSVHRRKDKYPVKLLFGRGGKQGRMLIYAC